jgi:LysR family transcriptional regulator, mexEF-oprN operon transcriptional activator
MTDLRMFDLNLLVAFDALMAERNVTRAARRVGVGQPAMSYSLTRLRELFGDELFVRTAGTMQPTTRALGLAAPVGRVIADIRQSVLANRTFKPDQAELTFQVGATDHSELAILPGVLTVLRSSAPKVRLAVKPIDRDRLPAMLESGAIDLAVCYFPAPPGPHQSEVLFHEDFVCLFDPRACRATAPLKLKTYLELPHIIVSLRGELTGNVDAILTRAGSKRFVFMATPHFLAVPYFLHGLRAVAALPRRLAEHCRDLADLTLSALPIAVEGFDVSMHWHARTETDPAHRWFRDLVRRAARPQGAGSPSPGTRSQAKRKSR